MGHTCDLKPTLAAQIKQAKRRLRLWWIGVMNRLLPVMVREMDLYFEDWNVHVCIEKHGLHSTIQIDDLLLVFNRQGQLVSKSLLEDEHGAKHKPDCNCGSKGQCHRGK